MFIANIDTQLMKDSETNRKLDTTSFKIDEFLATTMFTFSVRYLSAFQWIMSRNLYVSGLFTNVHLILPTLLVHR